MIMSLPLLVLVVAWLYSLGMQHLEGEYRSFADCLEWAAETITSTGYGQDSHWQHPVMIGFVIVVQFLGVFLVLMVFPIFVIPFIEERFERRLPTTLPNLDDQVVIYRYGPAVETLVEELRRARLPVVILEEDVVVARRLHDRGHKVVLVQLEEDDPDLSPLANARILITNGPDHDNAVITLSAREQGFEGTIVALVADPFHRQPMMRAGASMAFTPQHMLAAALAARASANISPRVAGVQPLGGHLEIVEVRVHDGSPLAGKTLAESGIRSEAGATIVGQWVGGALEPPPGANTPLQPGTILIAAGSQDSIRRLGDIIRPIAKDGPILIAGYGGMGSKIAELLTDVGEEVQTIDVEPREGVTVEGDALDRHVLERAGLHEARAVIIALGTDSATLFASAVTRDLAPEIPIIASVAHTKNISRTHRAGADFAMSVSRVAGQILAYQVLGEESVSLERSIKLIKVAPGELAGKNPIESEIRQRTGCSIVAVERNDDIIIELDGDFRFRADDAVYICGSQDAVDHYFEVFPGARTGGTA